MQHECNDIAFEEFTKCNKTDTSEAQNQRCCQNLQLLNVDEDLFDDRVLPSRIVLEQILECS
jgi:hypothetical protein